jgi:hypothetical protein
MTDHEEVQRLAAVITVDADTLAEQVTAFYETFTEEVPLPTTATVVGATIEVVGIDIAEHVRCSSHAATARTSCRTCTFRTWCLLPTPQLDGFTRPTAAALAWCRTRLTFQKDGSRPGCERQVAYAGRRGRVIPPPAPVSRHCLGSTRPVNGPG